jgi:hypothetical protein
MNTPKILYKVLTFFVIVAIFLAVLQLFAPFEYKPLNSLLAKKYDTSLKFDQSSSVVSLDDCNLSLQYPKSINSKAISLYQLSKTQKQASSSDFVGTYTLIQDESINNLGNSTSQVTPFVISCSKNLDSFDDVPKIDISKDNFYNNTKFFVASNSNVTNIKVDSLGENGLKKFSFKFGDLYYIVNVETKKQIQSDDFKNGIYSYQVDMQFNNVAKNTSNEKIKTLSLIKE